MNSSYRFTEKINKSLKISTDKIKYFKIKTDHVPWSLVISSFINKSGEMAMSLLPMLLIERQISSSESSLIMGLTKAAQFSGFYFGGLLTDLLGFKIVILISYLLGFIGFTALPFLYSGILISFFSVLAQFGASLFNPSARALIREISGSHLKVNMAWLRTASNLGQVVSSIFGILLGPLGLIIPFIVDGLTSFLAFLIGIFKIDNIKPKTELSANDSVTQKGFYLYSVGLAFFYFIYELGFLSISGFGKLALGNEGIRAFSVALLVNTLLCGLLAVPASKIFIKPKKSLITGFLLIAFGMGLVTLLPKSIINFGLCSLIMTFGEVIFSVFSQTLLLVNSSGKSNKHYGLSLMIQSLGRFTAGIVLFPFVLNSNYPSFPFLLAAIGFFIIIIAIPTDFFRRGESN